jgi:fibro-slime domain-containing protein
MVIAKGMQMSTRWFVSILLAATACSASSNDGAGFSSDGGAQPSETGNGDAPPSLGGTTDGGGTEETVDTVTLTIRDFKLYSPSDATTNPDFENVPKTPSPWPDAEIVAGALGADGKPVYKNTNGTSATTHGKAAFDMWYRDVPGTNVRVDYPLKLTPGPGDSFGYDSEVAGVPFSASDAVKMFFPIDDGSKDATVFGNQGDAHNYSFTAEAHTVFTYRGGETFHYRGDDDVFVYVDRKLVINLGGIHDPQTGDVNVDALGLVKGSTYPLDFFFAERHKGGSNVLFTTTIKLRPVPK